MVEDGLITLAECVAPVDIYLDLQLADAGALFDFVGLHMERAYGVPAGLVARSLARREQIGSTAIGHGAAVPHARIGGIDRPHGLYARLKTPIEFGADDGRPVMEFVVLLVPAPANDQHLALLAEVSGKFTRPTFRSRLRGCASRLEAHRLLSAPARDVD